MTEQGLGRLMWCHKWAFPIGRFPRHFFLEFTCLLWSDGNSPISARPVKYVLLACPWQIATLLYRQSLGRQQPGVPLYINNFPEGFWKWEIPLWDFWNSSKKTFENLKVRFTSVCCTFSTCHLWELEAAQMRKPAGGKDIPALLNEKKLGSQLSHSTLLWFYLAPWFSLGVFHLAVSQTMSSYGSGGALLEWSLWKPMWTVLHQILYQFCTCPSMFSDFAFWNTPHNSQLPLPRTFNTQSNFQVINPPFFRLQHSPSLHCFRCHEWKPSTSFLTLRLTRQGLGKPRTKHHMYSVAVMLPQSFQELWSWCREITDVRDKFPPIFFSNLYLMYFDVAVLRERTLAHSPSSCFACVCIYPHWRTKRLNCYNCSSSSLVTPPNSSCANLLSSSVRACQTWGVSLVLVPSFQQQLAHPAAV